MARCVTTCGSVILAALVVAGFGVASAGGRPLPKGPLIASVYCPNRQNVDCSRVYGQGKSHYRHAPHGFDRRLGCRWYEAGYSPSLGVDKHFCIANPRTVFFAQSQAPENRAYRPHVLYVAGEGSFYIKRVSWRRWGRRTARGSGIGGVDDCRPGCANGTFHYKPVRLTLWRPRRRCGARVWTRMTIAWTHGAPRIRGERGKRRSVTPLALGPCAEN